MSFSGLICLFVGKGGILFVCGLVLIFCSGKKLWPELLCGFSWEL